MKQSWESKKIGDILSLEYGKPLSKDKRTSEGLYPVYGANGVKDRTNEYYSDEPSIIVGRKGSAGEINYTEEKFWPLDVTYFVKFDKTELNLNFLYHLLSLLELPALAKGVKPGINRNDVYAIETLIPLLPEQKRIVAILDRCFEAIDKAKANVERNLQNTKDLFQSELNQIFTQKGDGWVEKKLGEVFLIKPPKKEAKDKLNQSDMVTFLPMTDLKVLQKDIPIAQQKKLNEVAGSYTYFADDDVLMAKITPCFENGKLGVARNLVNGIGFGSSEYIVFRSLGDIKSDFLFYFLSRDQFRVEGKMVMTGAVGHKRVSKEFIENYFISFPKVNAQLKIIEKLEILKKQTEVLESQYEKELDSLDDLKKSILQKAFNGELTTAEGAVA